MPTELTSHLETATLDYTRGLWSRSSVSVPPGYAAQLDNCYPLPDSGALRAWAKWSTFSLSGIGASEKIVGFFVRGGIPVRSGASTENSDRYILTTGSGNPKLYRWDDTNDAAPPAAWTLIKTFTAGAVSGIATWAVFYDITDAAHHVYMSLQGTTTDQGVWRIRYSDGATTRVQSGDNPQSLLTYQDRLLVTTGEGRGSRIRWSDLGEDTFDAASFQDVAPNNSLTTNRWIYPYAGELLVCKNGAPFFFVQGDLLDPVVRQQGEGHYAVEIHRPAISHNGVYFMAYKDGIYRTQTGVDAEPVSSSLPADALTVAPRTAFGAGVGTLSFFENWLITPSAHILDERTGAWFKTTEFGADYPAVHAVDRHQDHGRFYAAKTSTSPTLRYITQPEDTMSRVRTYTYKSFPMRHPTGRQIRIRRVLLYANVFSSGASITVTVGGVANTKSALAAGHQTVEFLFNQYAEMLDVTITPDSGSDSVEAPMLTEPPQVFFIAGHLVT